MINAAAALFFTGFVLLALVVARRGRSAAPLLIVYVVTLTLGVAFIQLDFWPFSAWPLIAMYHPPEASHVRLAVADAAGQEHPIDARAFGTLSYPELTAWVEGSFPRLDDAQKRATFSWLLARIESARAYRARTGSFPRAASPLGPLTAPRFILMPHFWEGAGLPRQRLVALRLYRDSWNLEERAKDPGAVRRQLLYEYRSAP